LEEKKITSRSLEEGAPRAISEGKSVKPVKDAEKEETENDEPEEGGRNCVTHFKKRGARNLVPGITCT